MLKKRSSRVLILIPIVISVLGLALASACATDASDSTLEAVYNRDSVTIVVTDSGLGGLSVAAALEKGLREKLIFRKAEVVFVNALASREYLYNQMNSTAEKVRVFDSALAGMNRAFEPDLILIACNTLSVIYPQTSFSRTSGVPVVDVVRFGVEMMAEELAEDSSGSVIIMGTQTTIDQDTHRERLIGLGFDSRRIVTQACNMLESEIQNDPASDIVSSMIEMYCWEALEKQSSAYQGNLAVGLCCTHYGYAFETFDSVLSALTERNVTVVNPNRRMADFVARSELANRYESTDVTVEVVSQVELDATDIDAISQAVRQTSPSTAEALASYRLRTDLFRF